MFQMMDAAGRSFKVINPPVKRHIRRRKSTANAECASSLSQAKIVGMSTSGLVITVMRCNGCMQSWLGDREGPTDGPRSWPDRAASERR
jgi:hypothetical protein